MLLLLLCFPEHLCERHFPAFSAPDWRDIGVDYITLSRGVLDPGEVELVATQLEIGLLYQGFAIHSGSVSMLLQV